MSNRIINPILPGFYPDPSICVANGEFYLVNSSFSYVPGLPIFKSSNCIKWEQIGNVIHRPEQLDFTGAGVSRGLFAPTIRYNNGTFYCVCTQVDKLGNFFMTAQDPAGPWSQPIPIPEAIGIDPSLFFDDDGTCYYCGTRPAPEGPKYDGNWEVYIAKLNLETGHLEGEAKGVWRGALRDCVWPEGPHIYKINGMYYLMHAEGGTGPEHAVCIARSENVFGPYVGKKSNPILTHRHLGMGAGVVYVGHADLFQDNDKRWWMVCLASRPYGNGNGERFCNMGRETFMVPVKWEDGWPVVSWETGLVENAYSITGHVVKRTNEDIEAVSFPSVEDFNDDVLDKYWLSLRKRDYNYVSLKENSGCLRLYGMEDINGMGEVNMILRRQTGFSYEASTKVNVTFKNDNDCAGIVCFQNEKFNYRLQLKKRGKVIILQLLQTAGENPEDEKVLSEEVLDGGTESIECVLRVVAEKQNLRFEYGPDERCLNVLADKVDGSILSYEKAGGFVGTVIGMFAVSGSDYTKKEFYADFDWFRYENTTRDWTSQ